MQRKRFFAILGAAALIVLMTVTLVSSAGAVKFRTLYRFGPDWKIAANPYAGVISDAAGNVYGATSRGGVNNLGTIFELTPTPKGLWTMKVLYEFAGSDGAGPADVIFDAAGNLYGITRGGGAFGLGTVFELMPNPDSSWSETVLYSFAGGSDTAAPLALSFDQAGNLYGTGQGGAYNLGTVFQLTPNLDGTWSETVIYTFAGGKNGAAPDGKMAFDSAGNLYGIATVSYGRRGKHRSGTVFRLTPNPDGTWTEKTLHIFLGGRDGASPMGGLVWDAAGRLYGATGGGGDHGTGTIFMLKQTPDGRWAERVIHSFGAVDEWPSNAPVFNADGNLYGATSAGGGCYRCGTIYRLRPNPDKTWKISTVHTFTGRDGWVPHANLTRDIAGNLFGTTPQGGRKRQGGNDGYGVVFRITP